MSKTDSLGQGWFFSLTKAEFGGHTVAGLLKWYLDSLPPMSRSQYLFPTSRKEVPNLNRPVPYSTARLHLVSDREKLGLGKITWHSFRRGSVTVAAEAGISRTSIKKQGKWRSDCIELYIESRSIGEKIGRAIVKKF